MRLVPAVTLAMRYLFGRGSRRVFGGIVGVGLSLVPLVVVLQVADGMIEGIAARFIEAGTYHAQAIARGTPDVFDVLATAREIEEIPGVRLAFAERQGLGLAAGPNGRTGISLRAVEPDLFERDPTLQEYLRFSDGSWDLSGDDKALVGEQVAEELGVTPGDTIRVITVRSLGGDRFLPRSSAFTVTGVFSTGYQDLDRLWVYVPISRGARIIPSDSGRQIIGVKIEDPLALPNPIFSAGGILEDQRVRQRAEETIALVKDTVGTDYRVATWFELERPKYMSFRTTKNLLILIMVLIVVVAALNISSTLVMLVLEKEEEIAILKSAGAAPTTIRVSFVAAGFVLGALGTALGVFAGLLAAVNVNQLLAAAEWVVNALRVVGALFVAPFTQVDLSPIELLSAQFYLESIPIAVNLPELLLAGALSVLLATAAAYFPARRAARIRPLEVLRRH